MTRRALIVLTASLAAACATGSAAPAPTPTTPRPPPSSPSRPPVVVPAALRATADWTTYHHDNSRSGYVRGPDPRAPRVAWRARLDGNVYASPLVVGGRVLAATENGTVYSLDAATGRLVWARHLANPVPGSSLPCGNIDPVGITGTPVYDRATRQVFAVATQAGPRHVLYGVDVRTGAVRSRRGVDVPGSVPSAHLQRPALLLANRTIYIAYGGNNGDCGPYRGRVVGVPVAGGPLRSFSVPTRREGGIWAASGPAATPSGEVLVTTGNGAATSGAWDHSDSVLRLSPTLRLLDGFAPRSWPQENAVDDDLGSTGPLLLPGGARVVAAGKAGNAYLLLVRHLGGVGGHRSVLSGCTSFGGAAAIPATGGALVFLPCTEGLLQVRVRGNALVRGWRAGGQVSGSPIVVGSTVWSVQQGGALYGLDLRNGRPRALLQVGSATRFASPAASGNGLFVPTLSGVTAVRLTP